MRRWEVAGLTSTALGALPRWLETADDAPECLVFFGQELVALAKGFVGAARRTPDAFG